jgi:hypothetical protein
MNVLMWGATGMVGQGALRECLADPEVGRVVTVAAATTLVRLNPQMIFIYVSAAGAACNVSEPCDDYGAAGAGHDQPREARL